jgi:hypothetical protein
MGCHIFLTEDPQQAWPNRLNGSIARTQFTVMVIPSFGWETIILLVRDSNIPERPKMIPVLLQIEYIYDMQRCAHGLPGTVVKWTLFFVSQGKPLGRTFRTTVLYSHKMPILNSGCAVGRYGANHLVTATFGQAQNRSDVKKIYTLTIYGHK